MPYVRNEEGDIIFREWEYCDGPEIIIDEHCLNCPHILSEDYGACKYCKCMDCLNADSSH